MMLLEFPDWVYRWLAVALAAGAIALFYRGLFADRARGRRRCSKCWYELGAVNTLTCPECGRVAKSERRLGRARKRWWIIALAFLITLPAAASWMWPQTRRYGRLYYVPNWVMANGYAAGWISTPRNTLWEFEVDEEIRARLRSPTMSKSARRYLARCLSERLAPSSRPYEYRYLLNLIGDCGEADRETVRVLHELRASEEDLTLGSGLYTLAMVARDEPATKELIHAALRGGTWQAGAEQMSALLAFSRGAPPADEYLPALVRILDEEGKWSISAVVPLVRMGAHRPEALEAITRAQEKKDASWSGKQNIQQLLADAQSVLEGRARTLAEAQSRRLTNVSIAVRRSVVKSFEMRPDEFTPEFVANIIKAIELSDDYSLSVELSTVVTFNIERFQPAAPTLRKWAADERKSDQSRKWAAWVLDRLDNPR